MDCGEDSILSYPNPAGEPLLRKLAEGMGERPEGASGELDVGEGVRVRREGGLVEVGEGLDFRVEFNKFSMEKLEPVLVRRGRGRAKVSPRPGPLFFRVMVFAGLKLKLFVI